MVGWGLKKKPKQNLRKILTKSTNLVAKPKTARKTAPKLHVSNKVNEFFFSYPPHIPIIAYGYVLYIKKNHIFTHQPKRVFVVFPKHFTKQNRHVVDH